MNEATNKVPSAGAGEELLTVRGLQTHFQTDEGLGRAVDGVNFAVRRGETLALVGESGCGKSVTSLSILRLVPPPGRIVGGEILYRGRDMATMSKEEVRAIRGKEISMIFQEPMTSLNPVFTIGRQIGEVIEVHERAGPEEVYERTLAMLRHVGIPAAEQRIEEYPHQLSGGMRQRVMIAMALVCNPSILIADEPTTALDVTIQAQILRLLNQSQAERQMSMILITHDLGVVAETAQRVAVMYAGKIVEFAEVHELFARPLHPYTILLFESLPSMHRPGERLRTIPGNVPDPTRTPSGCPFHPRCPIGDRYCVENVPQLEDLRPGHTVSCWKAKAEGTMPFERRLTAPALPVVEGPELMVEPTTQKIAMAEKPLLDVKDLRTWFPVRKGLFGRTVGQVKAVDGVSFEIRPGRTLGLVGESGCGKTTTGRTVLGLIPATAGSVRFLDSEIFSIAAASGERTMMGAEELRRMRRQMQIIFQGPYGSLNPRMTVGAIVGEALTVHRIASGRQRQEQVADLLRRVGLSPDYINRYPHEFSGGQRQRIGIARALALTPRLIVCDEPVSALDVSIQSQILNLLEDLQSEFSLTYLFIAHDLSVVEHISDEVAVMYLGRIVEQATRDRLYAAPQHPYTWCLLSAIPVPDPSRRRSMVAMREGEPPSPVHPPSGCPFHPRCPKAFDRCAVEVPQLLPLGDDPEHVVSCHLYH